MQQWNQKSHLLTHLKAILNDYAGGTSLLFELLQNADDAEAKDVKFILDKRAHPTPGPGGLLWNPGALLGPSLLAYNNSKFKESDFDALSRIAAESKKDNVQKTGKFGIGFNSVYRITDCPSILSGEWLVYSDPHDQFIQRGVGGARIPFSEVKKHPQEFACFQLPLVAEHPFPGFRKINPCHQPKGTLFDTKENEYNGTLLRFPLRSEASAQAEWQSLENKSTSPEQIQTEVFGYFQNRFGGDVLLFLRHVENIELYTIEEDGLAKQIHQIRINEQDLDDVRQYRASFRSHLSKGLPWCGSGVISTEQQSEPGYIYKWLVTQCIGEKANNLTANSRCIGGCAMLLNGMLGEGQAFCSLPLPMKTHSIIPCHINGFFEMSSNRQMIHWETHEGTAAWEENASPALQWNWMLSERVISKALVHSFMTLRDPSSHAHHVYQSLIQRSPTFFGVEMYLPLLKPGSHGYWDKLAYNFYKKAWREKIFLSLTNECVSGQDAHFIIPDSLTDPTGDRYSHPTFLQFLTRFLKLSQQQANPENALPSGNPSLVDFRKIDDPGHRIKNLQQHEQFSGLDLFQSQDLVEKVGVTVNVITPDLIRKYFQHVEPDWTWDDFEQVNVLISYLLKDLSVYRIPSVLQGKKILFNQLNELCSTMDLYMASELDLKLLGDHRSMMNFKQKAALENVITQFGSLGVVPLSASAMANYLAEKKEREDTRHIWFTNKCWALWQAEVNVTDIPEVEYEWLHDLYTYISNDPKDVTRDGFEKWPLIPAKKGSESYFLTPKANNVIYKPNFEPIFDILQDLGLFIYNPDYDPMCTKIYEKLFFNGVAQLIVLLRTVELSNLKSESAQRLIQFITLAGLSNLPPESQEVLKALPVWEGINGSLISLPKQCRLFIISDLLPEQQQDIIELNSRLDKTILLKTPTQENEAILPLFKLIGVDTFTVNDFFDLVIETCLPNEPNKSFDQAIQIMLQHHNPKKPVTKIAASNCIWTGSCYQRPCDLYDPSVALFKLLFNSSCPDPLFSKQYFKQLTDYGMITLTATLELDPLKKIIKDFVACTKGDLSDTTMHAAKEIVTLVAQYQEKHLLDAIDPVFTETPFVPFDRELSPERTSLCVFREVVLSHEGKLISLTKKKAVLPASLSSLPLALLTRLGVTSPSIEDVLENYDYLLASGTKNIPFETFRFACDMLFYIHVVAKQSGVMSDHAKAWFARPDPWIPAELSFDACTFLHPSRISKHGIPPIVHHEPQIITITPSLRQCLSIQDEPSIQQIHDGLQLLKKEREDIPITESELSAISNCLGQIAIKCNTDSNAIYSLSHRNVIFWIPDDQMVLRKAIEMFVIDSENLKSRIDVSKLFIPHPKLNPVHANLVGCRQLSKSFIEVLRDNDFKFEEIECSVCPKWNSNLRHPLFREGLTRLFLQKDFNTKFPIENQLKVLNSIKVVRVKEIYTSIYVRVPPMTCLNKDDDQTPKAKDFLQLKDKESATIYITWDLSDKVQRSNAKQRVVELLLTALSKVSPDRDEISNQNSLLNLLTLDPKAIHPFLDLQNVPDIPHRSIPDANPQPDPPKPESPSTDPSPSDGPDAPALPEPSDKPATPQKAVSKPTDRSPQPAVVLQSGAEQQKANTEKDIKKPDEQVVVVDQSNNGKPSDKGKQEHQPVPRGTDGTRIQTGPVFDAPPGAVPHDGPIIQTIVSKTIKEVAQGPDPHHVHVPNLEPVDVPQQAPDLKFDTSARIPDIPENLVVPPRQPVLQDERIEEVETKEGVKGTAQNATQRMEEMIQLVFEEVRDDGGAHEILTPAQNVMIKKTSSSCALKQKPEEHYVKWEQKYNDMNIWLAPGINPSDYPLEAYDKFYQMLRMLAFQVFGLKTITNVISIFIEDGEKIAFNWKHSLYFNLHYFVHQPALPPLYKASFWYMTFCHELAHNVVHDHDARHEYVLQVIASKYMSPFEKIQSKLCQIMAFQEDQIIPKPVPESIPRQVLLQHHQPPQAQAAQAPPQAAPQLEPVIALPQLPPNIPASLMRAIGVAGLPLPYFTILVDALLNMGFPPEKIFSVIELMVKENNIKATTPMDAAVLMIFNGLMN